MSKCRIILVEDDARMASAVVKYLEYHHILCDHCMDGEKALNLMARNTYDVLVTDINMPNMSGLQLCTRLRQGGSEIPIIMTTSRADMDDKILGFEAGTDDYLVKPFDLKELLLRVIALSKRKSNQSTVLTISELALHLDFSQRTISRNGEAITLAKAGWTLMSVLARAWPHPVSKDALEFALWGDELPDSNCLKVHMHNLRQRIDHPFEHAIVHSVRGVGFVLAKRDD